MKRILVIAGTDSSGGAGLEADQKVIAAHGCYAMTATTALTAQNTLGVRAVHEVPPDFVRQQIDACVEDIGIDAVKTGMLASAKTVSAVAAALRDHSIKCSVVDPVMVASSGARLLEESAVATIIQELLPTTYLLTPNIPEAMLILKASGAVENKPDDLEGLKALATAIQKLGTQYVLLKGGHMPMGADNRVTHNEGEKSVVFNILQGPNTCEVINMPFQASKSTHGTGCSLASAITCNLAMGHDISTAVRLACRYVEAGIKTAPALGAGCGPLNHFHSVQTLPFSRGNFIEYLLEREDVKPAWHDYTHHDFVRGMGDGTLPHERFKHYMIQDYLYLIHFARANALAGYKAKTIDDIADAAVIVSHIRTEIDLHINECKQFGIEQSELLQHEESQACTAYSRYVLDIGQSEDWLALQISLLPCLLGYGVIAKRLHAEQQTKPLAQPNRYATWIDNYVASDYTAAVDKGCALIEKHAARQSPARIEELVRIFVHATKVCLTLISGDEIPANQNQMETGFWNMGLGQ